MTIKAVIFDVGGVLIRTHDWTKRREWEARLGLAEWESEQIVFGSPMGTKAQRGEITHEALWQWVGQRLALSPERLAKFEQDFWAGDALDAELVDYIRRLRSHYQTAIISNATDNLNRVLAELYPMADAFDLIVGSAYERVMKPNPEIYRRTLSRLGREAAETVFVDDNADNIQAARELGMAAVHFNPSVDVPAEFARLGIYPNSGAN